MQHTIFSARFSQKHQNLKRETARNISALDESRHGPLTGIQLVDDEWWLIVDLH